MDLIKAQNGSVPKTEYWGLKSLSFRIKKNRKGHYGYMQIEAPPGAVAELERNMRINEDVVRYLTVRVESHDPGPSAMMQARNARDDRGGGRGRRDDRGFGDDRGGGRRFDEPRDGFGGDLG